VDTRYEKICAENYSAIFILITFYRYIMFYSEVTSFLQRRNMLQYIVTCL